MHFRAANCCNLLRSRPKILFREQAQKLVNWKRKRKKVHHYFEASFLEHSWEKYPKTGFLLFWTEKKFVRNENEYLWRNILQPGKCISWGYGLITSPCKASIDVVGVMRSAMQILLSHLSDVIRVWIQRQSREWMQVTLLLLFSQIINFGCCVLVLRYVNLLVCFLIQFVLILKSNVTYEYCPSSRKYIS